MNKHATTKLSSTDKANNHQQSSMISNYHNNHLDYRNGSQMSFYDNQQQQQQQQSYDDELHRQHYFLPSDRQKSDTMHSGSDGSSSTKSEQQIPNIYHQQNGFLIKAKKQLANNNECDANDHVLLQRKPAKTNQYGKILNYNRNGSRPIPMLPSPPSTPPPPLNAKIKDHHESSNKFYQEYQSTGHVNGQQQNRFNGNGNVHNNNNNNEVSFSLVMTHDSFMSTFNWNCFFSIVLSLFTWNVCASHHRWARQIITTTTTMPMDLSFIQTDVRTHRSHRRTHWTNNQQSCTVMAAMRMRCNSIRNWCNQAPNVNKRHRDEQIMCIITAMGSVQQRRI